MINKINKKNFYTKYKTSKNNKILDILQFLFCNKFMSKIVLLLGILMNGSIAMESSQTENLTFLLSPKEDSYVYSCQDYLLLDLKNFEDLLPHPEILSDNPNLSIEEINKNILPFQENKLKRKAHLNSLNGEEKKEEYRYLGARKHIKYILIKAIQKIYNYEQHVILTNKLRNKKNFTETKIFIETTKDSKYKFLCNFNKLVVATFEKINYHQREKKEIKPMVDDFIFEGYTSTNHKKITSFKKSFSIIYRSHYSFLNNLIFHHECKPKCEIFETIDFFEKQVPTYKRSGHLTPNDFHHILLWCFLYQYDDVIYEYKNMELNRYDDPSVKFDSTPDDPSFQRSFKDFIKNKIKEQRKEENFLLQNSYKFNLFVVGDPYTPGVPLLLYHIEKKEEEAHTIRLNNLKLFYRIYLKNGLYIKTKSNSSNMDKETIVELPNDVMDIIKEFLFGPETVEFFEDMKNQYIKKNNSLMNSLDQSSLQEELKTNLEESKNNH
jgi:hypothetical protein